MKTIRIIVSALVIAAAFTVGFLLRVPESSNAPVPAAVEKVPVAVDTTAVPAGWVRYEDPAKAYAFAHPSDVSISASGTQLTLMSQAGGVPDMTMTVEAGHVEFRVWEDFEIPYFNDLVSSFRFEKK